MSKVFKNNPQQSKLILEELEERRLFSGGIEGLIVSDLDSDANAIYREFELKDSQAENTNGEISAAEQQSQEIVFVDAGVDNYQQLVDDLRNNADSSRNIEVVVLDRDKDGIEEISEFLSHREDLDAIHIISHGGDGSVELGNTSLNADTLEQNNLKIALWANNFADTGDILIYGCNLAASEIGQSLIEDLGALTLTDVAASDDITGHASLGGDWDLEYHAGEIDAGVAPGAGLQARYQHILAVINGTAGDDVLVGTAASDVISAGAGNDVLVSGGGSDQMLGEADDDIFRFTGAQDGDVYTVNGGTGTDTIDLSGYASTAVTFGDGTMTIDMGGESFSIDYTLVNLIAFSDITATVLTGSASASGWSGTGFWIDGDEAFKVDMSGAGTIDLAYDTGSDTFSVTGASGVDATSSLAITDFNGNDLLVDQITLDASFGDLTTNVGIGSISLAGASSNLEGTFTIGGDLGSINMYDLAGTLDVQGDLGTIQILNDLDPGALLNVTGDVTTLLVDDDIGGTVVIGGDVTTFDLTGVQGGSNVQVTASVTVTGSITTLHIDAGVLSPFAIGGDLGTFIGEDLVADMTVGGDVGSVTLASVDPAATFTANHVVGTLVFDVGGTNHGGTYATPVVYVFDGSNQTASDTPAPNLAPNSVNDSATTNENTAVVIDVLANDSDPDTDPLTARVITGPSNGTLVPSPVELINETNLTNDAANDREAQMSPDGSQIVFRSDRSGGNNDIWVMDADGSNPVQLTSDPGFDSRPVWSPDGSKILFTSDRSGDDDIWIMNANGSGQTNLSNNALGDDTAASWSADGSQIAFKSTRDGNDEIYVMNANGTGQINITNNLAKDSGADWSPDGSRILFVSDRGVSTDVWVMDTDGSNPINLTNNPTGTDSNASWSADSSKIIFKSDRDGGNSEIYVMDADGSNQTRLTDNAFVDGAPSWSPDGSQIIFQTNRVGNHEIYVADILSDGTFTYTPDAGFTGTDSFTYVANDGTLDSAVTTVTITVDPANNAPTFIDGSIGNWHFDEGSGDSVAESAIGISTGTLGSTAGADANDPTWTTGKFGQALHFDGVDDYVEIADAPGLDISGPEFSASLWMNPDSGPNQEDMLFMKGDRQGNINYYLSWKNTNEMTWAFKDSAGWHYQDMAVTLPTTGQWNHIGITFDRPTVSLYVNGTKYVFDDPLEVTGGSMDRDLTANNEVMWIGAGRDAGALVGVNQWSGPFTGSIDELALFDRALTDAEIEAIRTSTPPAVTASAFSIDENSANNTLVGTVVANDQDIGDTLSYAITGGNTAGAFSIDANGQIEVANSAALDFETNPVFNLTIEATDDGTPAKSDTTSVSISLNDVNDAPIWTSTALAPTWTENGGPVNLFSATSVDLVESGDLVNVLTISVTGLADGNDEILMVDGQAIELTNLNSETTAANGYVIDVSAPGSVASLTITRVGGFTASEAQTLIDGLAYDNTSDTPQGAARMATLGIIQDDGGTAGGGSNTTVYNLDSLVTVVATNDAPTVDLDQDDSGAPGINFAASWTEGGGPVLISDSDALIADADHANLSQMVIQITNIQNPGDETLDADLTGTGLGKIWSAPSGQLIIFGGGPISDFLQVLETVEYDNASVSPDETTRIITVTVDDGTDTSVAAQTSLSVTSVNSDPVITSDGGGDNAVVVVPESTTVVTTVTVTDPDLDTPTFSITGGDDAGLFSIDSNTGLLSFITSPSYEGPGDNSYQVQVTADDGNSGSDVQTITVNVTNLDPIANGAWFDETNGGAGYADFASLVTAHNAYLGTPEQTIDFESLTEGDVLSNQFSGSHGVTFSNTGINESQIYAEGGPWIQDVSGYDGSYTADGSNVYLKMANDDPASPFTIEFASPVSKVGAMLGMGKEGADHSLQVRLYDSGGNLLDEQILEAELWEASGTFQNYETFLGVSYDSAVISKIEILNSANVNYANALIVDQLQFSTTPDVFDEFNASTGIATVTGNVLANDIDPAGGTLTISGFSQGANGSVVYNNDGTFTYTSNASFTGTDTFTYTIADGQGGSDTATVTMQVSNAAPTITSDGGLASATVNAPENTTAVTTVTANDSDGHTPTFSITGGADQALFTILPTGELSFIAAPDFEGPGDNSYEVEVTANDGQGGTDVQTITVNVTDVNESLTAVDDAYSVSEDATYSSHGIGWFDSNWSYSRTLSFDNSTRTENLVDFPILVKLDSSVIDYAKTHDQGWDLRFVDQDGSALAHEIEHWDEAGTSYVWVKIPQIDASSSADSIVMYYGNAGVAGSGEDSAGVWSDYRATYHLNENPGATGTLADSAGNFDATNASSTDTAGFIGNAQDFNGIDQSINLGDDRNWINNASGATLSIWMNADTTSGFGDLIGLSRNDPADTGASRITLIRNGDDIQMIARTMDDSSDTVSVSTSTNPLTAGSWHHITGTIDYSSDIDNINIYVDGQLEGTFSHDFTLDAIPNTDSSHAAIGSDEDGTDSPFDGQLDEARIADQVRSADWISAQYAAMTGNLVDIGFEQTVQGVLINDVDEDGDALTVTQLNGAPAAIGVATALPSGAIVTMNADGSFVYNTNGAFESLAAGSSTTDTFTYQVTDGNGSIETAIVTMTVDGEDDAPSIGGTDTGAVTEDSGVVGGNISASGTLTISDDDAGESSFQAETITGTYGDLTIDGAGNWSYDADNGQAAIQQLDVSETLTDTLTVTTADGTTHDVVITINGAEDAAQIGGVATGTVAEDGTLIASNTLTITDTDTSDTPSFADVTPQAGDNDYGSFEMTSGTWTYTLDNNDPVVQALDTGETLSDTYTFTATDGSTQQVTVTINGAEDTPVFDSTAVTAATEDLAYSYTITTSDVDVENVTITAPTLPAWLTFVDNGDGTATLSGTPTNAEVGNHNVVLNVSDGTLNSNQNFTIVVANTNDPAVIAGADTGSVQEDVAVVANNISTTGTLTITDPDTGESTFQAATINGTYGDLTIDTAGNWTYTADNTQAAIQQLDALENITDTLTVTSFDGTTHNVVITINGSEDTAVIGGTTTGSVTEDGTLTSSGALTITDTDTSDTPSFADVGATAGDNAYGTFEMTAGTWTYTLDNNDPAVQALDVGETLTDTHTFTATDGSTEQVSITINGAEDTPVFDSTAVTAATEDLAYSYTIATSDVDIENVTITAPTLPAWLTFVDNGDGTATLSGTPTNAEVGNHNVVLNVSDGTLSSNQNFTIIVANTNDPAVIGGVDTGAVQEDVGVVANNISTGGLLSITDPDTGESTFQAATINGTYGDLTIDTAGNWTYTADNTQAAIQQLDALESITDTLTVTSFDGTTHNVVITINGSEDTSVIGGTTSGSVTEDGTLTSSGLLTITDTDSSDPTDFADLTPQAGDNGYGTFEITSNTWTYTLDNNDPAVQALDAGETLTDTYTFTAPDGVTQLVTVTINGAEDTPVFDSTAITAATEDLAYSYTITTSDVDVEAVTITAPTLPAWLTFVDNGDGTATLSGTPTNAEVGSHNVVLNVSDGTLSSNQSFTIVVGNTNDPAVIAGVDTGSVQEDVGVVANNISTSGTLTITDPDTGESTFQAATISGTYGDLTIDTAGNWTYTADNTQAAIQQLDALESITDTLTVTSFDGTTHNVVITINGSEDVAVIGGTTTGSVTEDGTLTSSGTLSITDTDTSDTPSFADVGVTAGDNGYGSFEMTSGTWTYTLDNNDPAVQALDVSETLTDTFTFTASDGNSQLVTVTINGAEDAPVFDSTAITAATEDVAYSYTITTSDVDIESVTITAPTLPAWLTLVDNGDGTATLNGTPTNAEVGSHNVVLNVSDGTLSSNQSFTIAVGNTNDPAVIGGTDTGAVQEDVAVVANNIGTSGSLTIADPDAGESSFVAATINGAYGDLVIDSAGNWSYSADNGQISIQALDALESITDTLTVTTFDGTTHNVVITINGSEDAAVTGGTATGSVTEDGSLTATDALTIADIDSSDNPVNYVDVAPAPGGNGYGNFEITGNTWTYTLTNGHAAVQALDVGETLTDSYTFLASDGSSQLVTVTINGAEDAPTLDNAIANQTATEDVAFNFTFAANTFGDVDTSDSLIYSATLADSSPLPAWLNFDAATRIFSGTPANADVGPIDIRITADDGSSSVTDIFTLTVLNVDDAPLIGGVDTGAVTEDVGVLGGIISTTGSLTITDPDAGESSFQPATVSGSYGDLTIDISGNWIYDADNNQAAIQSIDAGQSIIDTLTVSAFDGTTHDIVITINGAEDSAVIGGTAVGAVTEDSALVVSDTLMITDVDSNDNPISFNDVAATPGSNGYGSFEMTGNTWTYTLNNSHASVQALDVGETLTDTYTFSASDGSTQVVTVTINGSEDAPVIGGTATGAVSEDGALAASDTLTITDTDSSDNPISFNDVTPTPGVNGYGSFEMSGNTWTYTLNNSHASVQALDVGETLTDLFTFSASDGSTRIVTVTIGGAEDAPTLDNAIADQTANEDLAFNFTFATNTFGDLDTSDTLIYSATLADSSPLPGWLNFDAATRTFSGMPADADVGQIDIRITADDGSSSITDTFTLTINPANNAPLIGGVDSGQVYEDQAVSGGKIATSGALTIADPDAGESSFVGSTVNGALGVLTIDTAGNWRYSADNGNPEIQALQSGESISETLTVTTADGSRHDIVVTINGAAEASPAPPPPVQPPPVEPPPEDEPPPAEEETPDAGSGQDPIIDEVVRAPQDVTSPPVQEEADYSGYLQQEEAEADKARYSDQKDKPAVKIMELPQAQAIQQQAIQQQNLSLNELSLQVSDDETLNEKYELELLARIDSMHSGMDGDAAQTSADDVEVQIVMGSTASLTAGIVSWVLRGGSLLASFMSTVPLLNRFDPLPILKSREEKEDLEEDSDDDESDTKLKKHQQRVDKLFSAKDNAREQNGYMND